MRCHVEDCNEDATSQLLFIGILPVPVREGRFCVKHGKEYEKGEKFLIDFIR